MALKFTEFDISATYHEGDYCIYNGEKYTFSPEQSANSSVGQIPDKSKEWKKGFSKQDMIDFAEYIYNKVADLPGHEPNYKDLKDWIKNP